MVSLLLFSESHPRQPTGPSEPCVSGCFFLPAFLNYTSQQLAVQNVPTSPKIPAGTTAELECPVVSTNVPTRNWETTDDVPHIVYVNKTQEVVHTAMCAGDIKMFSVAHVSGFIARQL